MAGALRTAHDRKSQGDKPQSQEVRSLSSQSLLQLCGSRRPHSWTDLHLITQTNKAPNFVLKAVRVFSDFKKKAFDSSPLPGRPLPWAPPSDVQVPSSPRVNSLLGLFPGPGGRAPSKQIAFKKKTVELSLPNSTHSYCPPFSLSKSVRSQEIPTSFDRNLYYYFFKWSLVRGNGGYLTPRI